MSHQIIMSQNGKSCDMESHLQQFHQFYLNKLSLEDQLTHFFPLPKAFLDEWKKNTHEDQPGELP